jgi:structural maintenance of chromosome 4
MLSEFPNSQIPESVNTILTLTQSVLKVLHRWLSTSRQFESMSLTIHKITLTNFKSYAGVKVIGPFDKHLSAIIGANGSGKSNLIDALLFLFGKKAKRIRLSKYSELICSVNQSDSASVECIFEEIPEGGGSSSFISISRDVNLSGNCRYTLNGKNASFKEIHELLLSKGIDLEHNRFLILQGEVEQIAMMKPIGVSEHDEGMLEYLEDLIGSNKFIPAIKFTAKKLEEATGARELTIEQLKIAEKDLSVLESAKKEAEQFIEKMAKYRILLSLSVQIERLLENNELVKAREKLEHAKEQYETARSKEEELETEKSELQKTAQDTETKLKYLSSKYGKILSQLEELGTKDLQHKGEIKCVHIELNKKEEEKKRVDHSIGKLTKDSAQFSDSINKHQKELTAIVTELTPMQEEFQSIMDASRSKVQDLSSTKTSILDERSKLANRQGKLKLQLDGIKHDIQAIDASERQVSIQRKKYTDEIQKCEDNIKRRVKDRLDSTKLLQGYDENMKKLEGDRRETEGALLRAQQEAQEARRHYQMMKQRAGDHHSYNSSNQTSNLRKTVLEAHRNGQLGQIRFYGCLSDLGQVQPNIQTALTVALGGQADHFVVQSSEDAKTVIDYVKANRLGRATCIILDQSRSPQNRDLPNGAEKLIDLVQMKEPRFYGAFQFVLKDTLVASDIDVARRVSGSGRDRFRVVTLNGEVIDVSGAMTGGDYSNQSQKNSNQSRNAGGSPPPTAQELRQAEENFEAKEKQLGQCRQKMKQISAALDSSSAPRNSHLHQLNSYDADDADDRGSISMFKKKLNEVEFQASKSKSGTEKSRLQEEEARVTEEIEKCLAIKMDLDAKLEQVESSIANLGGKKSKELRSKIKELEESRKEAEMSVKKSQTSLAKCKGNLESHKKDADALLAAMAALTEKKAAIEDLRRKLEEDGLKLTQKSREIEPFKIELEEKLAGIKLQMQKIDLQIREAKKLLIKDKEEFDKEVANVKVAESRVHEKTSELLEHRKKFAQIPIDLLDETIQANIQTESEQSGIHLEYDSSFLDTVNTKELQVGIELLKNEIASKPNLKIIDDYRNKLGEYKHRKHEYEIADGNRERIKAELDGLERDRLDLFNEGYSLISNKVKELYQMLTQGGDAELEWIDTSNPFTRGIGFSVRPPKKSWKQISNLSGGEKTLSSLALVFALHYFKPTPLYFLDEIDAALDVNNVQIIANYLTQRAKNAQFIIISLRNQMFELADTTIGVYKVQDITNTHTIRAAELAKLPRRASLV